MRRIERTLAKADQFVKPYVKSLQLVHWHDFPVLKRLLNLVEKVIPERILRWTQLHAEDAKGDGSVTAIAAARSHTLRAAPPAAQASPSKDQDTKKVVVPGLRLDKLVNKDDASQDMNEFEKAGAETLRVMGDLWKSVVGHDATGKTHDDVPRGDDISPATPRRGMIVA